MKEASGEANITIITIVIISLLLAVGIPIVKTIVQKTETNTNTDCPAGQYKTTDGKCAAVSKIQ